MTRFLPARTITLALAAGMAMGSAALAAPDGAGEELPIETITLYRSGVGAFERRGLVAGDADVALKFDADQINDILKSMIVLDLSGGQIESVSYGSREPLARRLASFGIDLSNNPRMADLLKQLRGTKVQLDSLAHGTLTGTVFGEEQRTVADGEKGEPIRRSFVTLLTDQGLRTISIHEIDKVKILDEQLREDINRALAAMAEQRTDSVKTVDIALRGDGAREVVVGYVHEMPVWKASYRLVLPDFDAGGDPTVQGWAIVENTTDEDWRDVRLSLVAGRPVSFVMDLYEPLYLPRPQVPVPAVAAMRPKVYAEGKSVGGSGGQSPFSGGKDARRSKSIRGMAQSERVDEAAEADGAFYAGAPMPSAISGDSMASYAPAAAAAAVEVGAVFQYQLSSPVTIERRRSAMLPILSAGIEGRRVSIYDPAAGSEHPMTGVELTNTTGLQLMPGPVSVYDDGTYAGDAQIGHVTEDAKRLLSYAVDLDVKGESESQGTHDVRRLTIANGVMMQTTLQTTKTTYTITNGDDRQRVVLIEHPRRNQFEKITPEPSEKTKAHHRYEMTLAGGQADKLVVKEERTVSQGMALLNFNHDALMRYHREGKASQAVVDAFIKAQKLRGELNLAEREVKDIAQERAGVGQDQRRIRDNMGRIDRNSDLYRRYMTKLNGQETFLENLNERETAAKAGVKKARQKLNDFVSNLNAK